MPVSFYLYNADNQDLILSASKTPHPNEIGLIRLKLGGAVTGWVAKNRKTVSLPKNAHKDPRFVGTLPEDRYDSFLSIPILVKNNLIGVINARHKKPHAHPDRLINILETIGRQVGGAIETARLYKETKARARAIEALTTVSSTLTQDQYQEDIMQHITNTTAQMMGANICSIMLLDDKKQELRIAASHCLDHEYRNKPP